MRIPFCILFTAMVISNNWAADEELQEKVNKFLSRSEEPFKLMSLAAQAGWSPDGAQIAYTIKPDNTDKSAGINLITLDGTNTVKRLTTAGKDPVFSPDGKWVVYTIENMNGFAESVWLIQSDGEGEPVFIHEEGYPSWFPDSQTVLFRSRLDAHLYKVNITEEKKEPQKLFELPYAYPAFSNDGKNVMFGYPDLGLISVPLTQKNPKNFKTELTGFFLGRWSPDNTKVCYGGFLGANMGLFLVNSSLEEKPIQVLEGNWTRPSWSPDGNYIVYDTGTLPFEVWIASVSYLEKQQKKEIGF